MIGGAYAILFVAIVATTLDIRELIAIEGVLAVMMLYITIKNLIEKENKEDQ